MHRDVRSQHSTSIKARRGFSIKRFIRAPSADAGFDHWDWLQVGTLFLLWLCLLVLRNGSLPLQIWDESRLANSALEMVRSGHWLIPSYNGVPDHWNVKPPLLIWQMAVLMWLGLPPLLAVRLPTMLAALATVGTVWAVCRYALRDRVAAALAGFLLLSSLYYTDIHIARTGDYDVPLSLLTLLYVVAFCAAIERDDQIRTGWFAISVAAFFLAVMTKGVAGTFGLVGLLVFSLMRGRLVMLLSNRRIWLMALLVLILCLGYYGSRELYDPGYLQAVWQNELGPRFFSANEGHAAGRRFYFEILAYSFEPGIILLPLAAFTVLGTDTRRRSLVTLCLFCAAAILVVLTSSQTKIYSYATPILPFLAIAAALGVSDGLRWIKTQELRLPKPFRARLLQVSLGVLLAVVSTASLYRNQVVLMQTWDQSWSRALAWLYRHHVAHTLTTEQSWYGALFDELQARGYSSVLVLDSGFHGEEGYNPVLKFYADIAQAKGLRAEITPVAPASLRPGELVATCDPKLAPWLKHRVGLSVDGQVHSCFFGAAQL
jgi:4-amino-4-deoxy-L-arabinose transferase-like glycosyltransferase